jgi:putative hydrolase of the HAD superfamily
MLTPYNQCHMPQNEPRNDSKHAIPIEAVLFDFGMVLCGPPNPAVWSQMRAITGFEEEGLSREYWAHRHPYDRGTHTGESYWQLVAAGNGKVFSAEQVAELLAADIALWTDANLPMITWARRLQRAGVRTGILSNMGDAMEAGVLAKFDWLNDFDHCTWSHSLQLAKPEAAIYSHAAEGLGVDPAKILFIDDRLDNIEAAHEFGMQTIQYRDHVQFVEEMEARGFGNLLEPEGIGHDRQPK